MAQAPEPLKAYKVNNLLVFASRGSDAKVLAAPQIRPMTEWREDVAAWVALRAERAPEFDEMKDNNRSDAYIHQSS